MGRCAGFLRDRGGNVAVMFGLALLPMLFAVGAATDYARAAAVRVQLQAAVDSAALAAARDGLRMTDEDVRALARKFFDSNFTVRDGVTISSFDVSRGAATLGVSVAGTVKTAIMGVAGIDEMAIGANAESGWGSRIVELALALDNTGSMASSGKMTQLKAAVKDLLDILDKASIEKGDTRVAIVPFNTQVKYAYDGKNAPAWVVFDKKAKMPAGQSAVEKKDWKGWKGCITDRDMPYDTTDDGWGDVKSIAVVCEESSLQAMQPLTDDLKVGGTLYKTVDAMKPVGKTNVTIGIAHAAAMLSPAEAHAGAKEFGADRLDKYIIALTDGDNTENRFTDNGNEIDKRTRLACANAKDNSGTPPKNIRVYTIRLIDGDDDLLRDCASEPGKFYDARTASELTPVFQEIANEIASIRLTH